MKKIFLMLLLFPAFCFSQNKMWGTGGFNTNANLWYLINTSDSLMTQRVDSLIIFKPVRSGNIITPNLYGTSTSGGTFTLNSTSNGTKGNIVFGATTKMYYDENAQTLLLYSTGSQLRNRLGATSAGQSISTRDGQLSVGIVDDAQNSGLRFLGATSGLTYIDGYSEGSGKSSNYDIIIGSRVNNTGTAITNNTTAETGSNVQIGFQTATVPSSVLSLNTTTRGFLAPRWTNTQMAAISSPATGIIGYNTDAGTTYSYNGSGYKSLGVISGSYSSGAVVGQTVFTVTFGGTQPNATYKVDVVPTSVLGAALFYVTNKTTTTFDVTYLAGLTGTVTLDFAIFQ